MRSVKFLLQSAAASLLFSGALLHATGVTGVVTNRTTGKPAVGDLVAMVDPQAGMREMAHATTDTNGHYVLSSPDASSALVRVTHQGASYFIAVPQNAAPGDVTVYEVAAKVDGVSVEADVLEVETGNGRLHITERFFVHNTSSPPRTQWSPRGFEVNLPPEAVIARAAAQRPTGLATNIELRRSGATGHYIFDFPVQPDQGDKDTLFEVEYLLPYKSGSYTFHIEVSLPAQSVGVLLPKSMTFQAASGTAFQSVSADPTVQTFVARNAIPGKELAFTISGSGSILRDTPADNGSQGDTASGNQPGGGIGEPINTPDPLSKYKVWILSGLVFLLTAIAAFLLRRRTVESTWQSHAGALQPSALASSSSSAQRAMPLSALKEELLALESEKLPGTLTPGEYIERKAAVETAVKRTLNQA